jgi:hypothetical protein
MTLLETIQIATGGSTLLGILFVVYKQFTGPDIKAAQEIAIIKEKCKLTHQYLDENLVIIKENHLKHIEEDISMLKEGQVRIETILEERLPKK